MCVRRAPSNDSLPFCGLPLHLVNGFLCCAEMSSFDIIPFVDSCYIKISSHSCEKDHRQECKETRNADGHADEKELFTLGGDVS